MCIRPGHPGRLPPLCQHPLGTGVEVLADAVDQLLARAVEHAGPHELGDLVELGPQIVVVHDEVDIPFDAVRLKRGGGEGGHNGLRDISKALGTKDYLRVRVGVGRPPGSRDTADHVLAPFTSTERRTLELLISDAADAVEAVVLEGLTAAQQRFHSRETR